jgi:hypothetical protein
VFVFSVSSKLPFLAGENYAQKTTKILWIIKEEKYREK